MRKITPNRQEAERLANAFVSLPAGMSRYELCDELTVARAALRIDSDALCLLKFYIKHTNDIDWQAGNEPICAWSRFEICCLFGWSESKLYRIENALIEAGLISYRVGANGKRYAYRDETGALDKVSGISLAPVGARAAEIAALARKQIEDTRLLAKSYGVAFELRHELLSLKGVASAVPDLFEQIVAMIADLPNRKELKTPLDMLLALIERSRKLLAHVRAALDMAGQGTAPAANGASEGVPTNARPRPAGQTDLNTRKLDHSNPTMSEIAQSDFNVRTIAHRGLSSDSSISRAAAHQSRYQTPDQAADPCLSNLMALPIKSEGHKEPNKIHHEKDNQILQILMTAPDMLQLYLGEEHARSRGRIFDAIGAAVERYAHDLAIPSSILGRTTRQHGMTKTLLGLIGLGRMTEKGAEIRNPAGYLTKLVQSA